MKARSSRALGGRRASAQDALATIASHAVSRPVIVDVTSGETADLLHTALGQGFDVVLANKKPLTQSWASYEATDVGVHARRSAG